MSKMNKVFFSSLLKSYECWPKLEAALQELDINYDFLEGTKDIWVRDFMPIVSPSGRYVTYNYAPDYLRDKPEYITDGSLLTPANPRDTLHLDLTIDGGNIVSYANQLIFCDKLLKENKEKGVETVHELAKALDGCRLTILPWDKREPYGHADGMVRFIDEKNVVMNNYGDYDETFRQKVLMQLTKEDRFQVHELHFDVEKPHKYNWAYINFLQVGDKFILPKLNAPEDEQALKQIASFFHVPEQNIRMVDIHTILQHGGGLNCISWNAVPEEYMAEYTAPTNVKKLLPKSKLKKQVEGVCGYSINPEWWSEFYERFLYFFILKKLGVTVEFGKTFFSGELFIFIYKWMHQDGYLILYTDLVDICKIVLDSLKNLQDSTSPNV